MRAGENRSRAPGENDAPEACMVDCKRRNIQLKRLYPLFLTLFSLPPLSACFVPATGAHLLWKNADGNGSFSLHPPISKLRFSGIPRTNNSRRWSSPTNRPIPVMPSQLFQQLALSQLELLAASLVSGGQSKVKSTALYLPQENSQTGQLEFLPAVLYPHPTSERIFIASQADSGVAPTLPRTLTKLPGFAHAQTLLPGYPMVSSGSEAGVGVVEEVFCDLRGVTTALSVPLFSGSQTVGVLLVSPAKEPRNGKSVWTAQDRQQVARAATSLSLALSMDAERAVMEAQNLSAQAALSDGLHQLKNPLQALRTYGKLLQRRIADTGDEPARLTPQLLELAEHLMIQSDRLADNLKPVDSIVDGMAGPRPLLSLRPADRTESRNGLIVRPQAPLPWETDTIAFARMTDPGLGEKRGRRRNGRSSSNDSTNLEYARSQQNGSSAVENTSPSQHLPLCEDLQMEMAFMDDVLEPIVSAFRAIALDRGVNFVVESSEELPGVTVCPQALQEAISNILDNAFKYVTLLARPGGGKYGCNNPAPTVCLRLRPNEPPVHPGVTVLVEDNGPGIRPEDREAIFERGFRSPETTSVDGSGIGLDISRSLVERMGGRLRLLLDAGDTQAGASGTTMELVLYRNPVV